MYSVAVNTDGKQTALPTEDGELLEIDRNDDYDPPPSPTSPGAAERQAFFDLESNNIARDELRCVQSWVEESHYMKTALTRLAVHVPSAFTAVVDFECKLYTALTNVVWINEESKSAYMLSMREASGVAAFVSSVVTDVKKKDYMDGPYCGAPTGEKLSLENENEMHALLRGLGFKKQEVPDFFDQRDAFWKHLQENYFCPQWMNGKKKRTRGDFEADRPVWETAVTLWCGDA